MSLTVRFSDRFVAERRYVFDVLLGDFLGLAIWWIGGRMSPTGDRPVRVPLSEVATVNRREIRLRASAPTDQLKRSTDWLRDHVVSVIPGGSR